MESSSLALAGGFLTREALNFLTKRILDRMKCIVERMNNGGGRRNYFEFSHFPLLIVTFCSVQSLSCVQLFATPWTAAHQASLFITNTRSLLKLMSIMWGMPSNHLILCRPLLLPPSTFPSIRVFSNESVLHIRRPKYWSFSFSISPSNEYSGLISFRIDGLDLLAVQGLSRVFSNTTGQKQQFFGAQLFL